MAVTYGTNAPDYIEVTEPGTIFGWDRSNSPGDEGPADDHDNIIGSAGDDYINGGAGNDTIDEWWGGGDDTILGGAGNDTIYAEYSAIYSVDGGSGDDSIVVAGRALGSFQGGEGLDQLKISHWGVDISKIELSSVETLNTQYNEVTLSPVQINSFQYITMGTQSEDGWLQIRLSHSGRVDFREKTYNSVFIRGSAGDDIIIGTDNRDDLWGAEGNDRLYGGAGNDWLYDSGHGDDFLDGGVGADAMEAGRGDDTYVVDDLADGVLEGKDAGFDTVLAKVSYSLYQWGENDYKYIEMLKLLGSDAIDGTGNNIANIIRGNSAANVLDGMGGADTLIGGEGDDIYVVDDAGDVAKELSGGGADTVRSSLTWTLSSHVENLVLTGSQAIGGYGNALANLIIGNDVGNTLDGKVGDDTMVGGLGDDVYLVDDVNDVVTELRAEGHDLVRSSATYGLAAEVEDLILTGAAAISGAGNDLANRLTGNSGANRLAAGLGADTLAGGLGRDTLLGGAGDDTYVIDDAGDVVIELAGEGVDAVRASVTYTLTANVENLVLTGGEALKGYGNALANRLTGNSADNVLDGREGADIMRGGAGDDTYRVNDAGDVVAESANGGFDTVRSSVTYTLTGNVEKLVLTDDGDLAGTGNTLANELFGNASANRLAGKLGADRLTGGGGEDVFVFDTALGGSNVDTVTDFASAVDRIELSALVFRGLASGSLTADAFALGREATDLDDRILYDRATGGLFFDRDGSANVYSAVQFATLTNRPAIEAADFEVA